MKTSTKKESVDSSIQNVHKVHKHSLLFILQKQFLSTLTPTRSEVPRRAALQRDMQQGHASRVTRVPRAISSSRLLVLVLVLVEQAFVGDPYFRYFSSLGVGGDSSTNEL